MTAVQRFRTLFRGREDVWGHIEGRCVRERLTDAHFERHLFADGSIGVYPLMADTYGHDTCWVHWGATDIDRGHDMMVLAKNINAVLRHAGITGFIEKSKGKGYHVLVFPTEPVAAEIMRNALIVAHQIAGVPATEVYPKQTQLTGAGFGNYLNLPYAALWAQEGRRVVLDDDGEPMSLGDFLDAAEASKCEPAKLANLAAMYREPVKVHVHATKPYDGNLGGLVKRLGGLAYRIFKDGPLEKGDRSTTLMRLGHLCAEDGLSEPEALAVLIDADARWGKFYQRSDGERRLAEMLRKAYA